MVDGEASRYMSYDVGGNLREVLISTGNHEFKNDGLLNIGNKDNLQLTQYWYNGWGELVYRKSPATGETFYTRDKMGRVIIEATEGIAKAYRYDALGRLIYEGEVALNSSESIIYEYDLTLNGRGKLSRVIQQKEGLTTDYEYDIYGNLAEIKRSNVESVSITQYEFDAFGKLLSLTYPSGHTVSYSFDEDNRISEVHFTGEDGRVQTILTGIEYDYLGRPAAYDFGAGLSYKNINDFEGNLKQIRFADSSRTETLDYTFSEGYLLNIDYGTPGEHQWSKIFQYDFNGRLYSLTDSDSFENRFEQRFSYDDYGNRLSNKHYRFESLSGQNEILTKKIDYDIDPVSNQVNQYELDIGTFSASRSYEYNALGQLINDGVYNYEYNSSQRLTQINRVQGGLHALYEYDHNGLRTRKLVSTFEEINYHYDTAGRLLQETDSEGEILREYIYLGRTPVAILVSTGRTGVIGAQPTGQQNLELYYPISDHIGAIRAVVDQHGDRQWQRHDMAFSGNAFGEFLQADNSAMYSGSFHMPLRFPGQYFDKETFRHYNHYRYYDPTLGRYISSDPIGLAGGGNTYIYALNNPVMYYDPYGLFSIADYSLPQGFVDFVAGFGDTVSGGITVWVRDQLGTNGVISPCSAAYGAGGWAGTVHEYGSGIGGIAKRGIKRGVKSSVTKSPASRLADKAQGLPSSQRPNTVAVIKHKDGTVTVGRNQGGYQNSTVQNALDNAPANCFAGQCAEVNALSRALNKGRSLDGATISVSNVRGAGSASGIHGTPKTPCNTCSSVLDQLGVKYTQ